MLPRVLVVDDSPTVRKVVASILARSGYDVALAADGSEALAVLDQPKKVDLLLLDFVMPRMTGYELCRKLRAEPRHKALPVVLMSAKAEKIRDQFVEQTGALDAITKPFDPRALLAVVEASLHKAEHGTSVRIPEGAVTEEAELLPSDPPPSLEEAPLADALADVVVAAGLESQKAIAMGKLAPHLGPEATATVGRAVERQKARHGGAEILRGDASAIPLGEVLQVLQMQMQSGLLSVTWGDREVSVVFRDGMVDIARSRGVSDEFRLGRYLREDGIVTEEQLDDAVRDAKDSKSLLGAVVIARGLAVAEDVEKVLSRQTSELVFEMLSWKRAHFTFARHTEPEGSPRLGLPVSGLVMEAYQRVDEWQQIERAIDFDQVLVKNPAAMGSLPEGKLSSFERKILDLVDGEIPVREVIRRAASSSFDACKALFQFTEARVLRKKG